MKKQLLISLALMPIILLNGCTYRLIDFTTISSKNVTLNLPQNGKGQRVKGSDYVTVFLGIPFGTPNLKEATDRAIESTGNGDFDALIDGVVYQKRKWFFLYGKYGYEVEGTPIKSQSIGMNAPLNNQERVQYNPPQTVIRQQTQPQTTVSEPPATNIIVHERTAVKGKTDYIFKKDGTVAEVKLLEMSSTEILYKKLSNLDGPSFRIKISDVKSIQYGDGTKENF